MMWTDPSGKTWMMDPLLEALTALGAIIRQNKQ